MAESDKPLNIPHTCNICERVWTDKQVKVAKQKFVIVCDAKAKKKREMKKRKKNDHQ